MKKEINQLVENCSELINKFVNKNDKILFHFVIHNVDNFEEKYNTTFLIFTLKLMKYLDKEYNISSSYNCENNILCAKTEYTANYISDCFLSDKIDECRDAVIDLYLSNYDKED